MAFSALEKSLNIIVSMSSSKLQHDLF